MPLTDTEKAAGRQFRDEQAQLLAAALEAEPLDLVLSPFVAHVRHNCEARGGRSTSFRLHEGYTLSPEYPGVPAGFFAFFWKRGKCACGLTGGSAQGQLVLAADRPPAGRT